MVKVRVLNAVVDGKGRDTLISIDEQSVDALVKLGYVEVVKEDKQKSVARSVDKEKAVEKEEVVVEEVKASAPKPASKTRKTSNRQKNKSE